MNKYEEQYLLKWMSAVLKLEEDSPEVKAAVKKINLVAKRDNVSIGQAISGLDQLYAAVKTALSELDVSKSTQRRLISLLPNGGGAGGGYDESYEVIGGGSGPGGGNIGPVLYGGGGGGGGHGGGEPGGGGGGGGGKPSPKSPSDDVRIEAELDEVDIQTLKDISRRDKVVADLFQVQQWADAISNILKKTVPGPAKILLTVTDSQIEAWGKINKGLNSMGLAKSCIDIGNQEAMAYAENRSDAGRFWNSLKRSRGC